MIYQEFQELRLSSLGLGTMRLPVVGGNQAEIDIPAATELVDLAMAQGVNYFDTAWGYHGGNSEKVLGQALRRHPRDSFFLADKFPGYDLGNMGKVEEIFEEQLRKCQVDYFDFYLLHNVCELNLAAYLDPQYGILDYLLKQKAAGRIRHLGFSAHGGLEILKRFLDAWGGYMEFCQIQLNYLDWTLQDAKSKVELLNARHLPIWVMEPLRGGKLAQLPHAGGLSALRPDEGIPAWGFRFLQSIPGVTMILSGISNKDQLLDNLRTFETRRPLDAQETEALLALAGDLLRQNGLPCTACSYCVSHCPQGLDIPALLNLYNEYSLSGGVILARIALSAVPEEKWPSACVACRSCEAVCPQQIKISEALAILAQKLDG